jgi:hypothetical protein
MRSASAGWASISNSFRRLVEPRRSVTDRRGTLTARATARSTASVARPESAGSTTRTTRAPSWLPPTCVVEVPGRTWTCTRTSTVCSLEQHGSASRRFNESSTGSKIEGATVDRPGPQVANESDVAPVTSGDNEQPLEHRRVRVSHPFSPGELQPCRHHPSENPSHGLHSPNLQGRGIEGQAHG